MVSLRRAKLKAKRAGLDVIKIDKCNSHKELEHLIKLHDQQDEPSE